jgi:hypothetical protein
MGWPGTALMVLAATAVALGAAAWTADSGQNAAFATASLPAKPDRISFADRFLPASTTDAATGSPIWKSLDRAVLSEVEIKLREAKGLLARQLSSDGWRAAALGDGTRTDQGTVESKPPATSGIPLPRSRPAVAVLESRPGPAVADNTNANTDTAARPDDRTLMQKLSDLLPGKIRLASLSPDAIFRQGPDLAALGYDSQTAVYDITAQAVYLPNGMSLEAHSGMGSLKDDPEHVSVPMAGATPPATYDLKPRERLFHGVQALRMIPVDGTPKLGRSGLLTHSFMLGPNGDSNGCVSIRNYERFLRAYTDGEITRLVVVPSMNAVQTAQRSDSQS